MAGFENINEMKKQLEWAIDQIYDAEDALSKTDLPMKIGTPILEKMGNAKSQLCHIAQGLRLA